MEEDPRLSQREWTLIFLFLALLASLVSIAYLSDVKADREITKYLEGGYQAPSNKI